MILRKYFRLLMLVLYLTQGLTELANLFENIFEGLLGKQDAGSCIRDDSCKIVSKSAENVKIVGHSFMAFLYNPIVPHRVCAGAIIGRRWILDNCIDQSRYKYIRVKVGMHGSAIVEYDIDYYIQHENYEKIQFNVPKFNSSYLWAARDALVLHHTERNIIFGKNAVNPIRLHQYYYVPNTGLVIYLNKDIFVKRKVFIMDRACCNYYFRPYFQKNQQVCLEEDQFCVYPLNVQSDECCESQAFLVINSRLLGVMAWSTACSSHLGTDPWVFTHVKFFLPWISKKTS